MEASVMKVELLPLKWGVGWGGGAGEEEQSPPALPRQDFLKHLPYDTPGALSSMVWKLGKQKEQESWNQKTWVQIWDKYIYLQWIQFLISKTETIPVLYGCCGGLNEVKYLSTLKLQSNR